MSGVSGERVEHEPTYSPAYGMTATYVQVACSCGWDDYRTGYRTKREAEKSHAAHVTYFGSTAGGDDE